MEFETLYCIKGHTYDRKWRNPGESVQVRKHHSKVLIALGRMSREPTNVIAFKAPAPKAEDSPQDAQGSAFVTPKGDEPELSPDEAKAALRAEYKALFGKDAAGRMSLDRLREEVAKKKGKTE